MGEVDCVKSELYKGTRLENERGRPEIIKLITRASLFLANLGTQRVGKSYENTP